MAGYNDLDATTKAALGQRVQQVATEQGITPQQALFNHAKSQGMSNSDIDSWLGAAPNSTTMWALTKDTPASATAAATTQAATTPAAGGAAALDPATRNAIGQRIQQVAGEQGISQEQALYNYAKEKGVNNAGIDSWLGAPGGTTDNWLAKSGGGGAATGGGGAATGGGGAATGGGGAATGGATGGTPAGGTTNPVATTTTPSGIIGAATKLPDPKTWTVTADQTVEGRINRLTDPNSPLIQQAQARARAKMNSYGLLNSSLGITAGESAAYDAAMPIAQADAAAALRAGGYNVEVGNQFAVKDTDTTNQFSMVDKNAQVDLSKMNAQQVNDLAKMAAGQGYSLQTMDKQQVNDLAKIAAGFSNDQKTMLAKFGYDKDLVQVQRDSNKDIARIEAQYRTLTQGSASAANILTNLSTNVARIMENDKMDAAAKQSAINIYTANSDKALMLIGAMAGDIDLSSLLSTVLADTKPI